MSTSNEHMPAAPVEPVSDLPSGLSDPALPEPLPIQRRPITSKLADVLAAIGLWALSVIFLTLVPALIALPYILYKFRGVQDVVQAASGDSMVIFISVVAVIPAHLLTFGAAWALVSQFGRRPFWRSLGWSWGEGFGLWSCVGLALALFVLGTLVAWLLGSGKATDIEILVKSSAATRIALAVLASTTGPLVEEVIYRGVLYGAFERAMGTIWAVIFVTLLFTLVHVFQYRNDIGVIIVIAILSLSLTLVRAKSGRLLPCFIIHMVFNGIQSVLIVFHPYIEQFENRLEQKVGLVVMCTERTLQSLF